MGIATFDHARSLGNGRRSLPAATPASGQSLRHSLLTIACVLRQARQEAGLSQRSLARRLGKANSHVSKIESGQRRVDAFELYLIAGIVGLDPAALFARLASALSAQGSLRANRPPFAGPDVPAQDAARAVPLV